MKNKIVVVIPASEPPLEFVDYIKQLKAVGLKNILVVDDGNPDIYKPLFDDIKKEGAIILRHGINLGKGRSLKTAFNYLITSRLKADVVVTADCDGTYLPEDVLKVAKNVKNHTITIGSRNYSDKVIPEKNRRNNYITHYLLKLLAGIELNDTQSGLRAYPSELLPYLLRTIGERYDYDFNVIFDKKDIGIYEIPITPTPRKEDKKTHFRPVSDSWTIIWAFLIFIIVSLSSTLLDIFLYNIFIAMLIDTFPIFYITISTFVARIFSDTYNYLLDRKLVFKAEETSHFSRYVILATAKTAASALLVSLCVFLLGDGELWIKIIVDMAIFFVGYRIEKNWVYVD